MIDFVVKLLLPCEEWAADSWSEHLIWGALLLNPEDLGSSCGELRCCFGVELYFLNVRADLQFLGTT